MADDWASAVRNPVSFVERVSSRWTIDPSNPMLTHLHPDDADFLVHPGLPSTSLTCLQEIGFSDWQLHADDSGVLIQVAPTEVRITKDGSIVLHDGQWHAWANRSVQCFSASLAVFCNYWDAADRAANRESVWRLNNVLWDTLKCIDDAIATRSDSFWAGVSDWVGFAWS